MPACMHACRQKGLNKKNKKSKTKNQKPKTKNQKPKTKNEKQKTKNKKQKTKEKGENHKTVSYQKKRDVHHPILVPGTKLGLAFFFATSVSFSPPG